ncbi:glycosyltransferase [Opacimonas viscosa]|uniref:Glycosyltransferase n=1 Tax=Opacimonas viscosa TaxID=2961944 RepID=A0AA41WZ02_9ALTE|nr:glycosyltransferase [Opacimonas viscosa]MCP3429124.1 glycosyltransferase [Opacimonas viscosa]
MKIVISAINLVEGGPLTVLKDIIKETANYSNCTFYVLCHKSSLFDGDLPFNVELLEYPTIKSSWIKRLYFEYFYSNKISKNLVPDIWLSLHDMTPKVSCKRQYVYCHNPSPFRKPNFHDLYNDKKQFIFGIFYKYLYRINIHLNHRVIVQQDWIADFFKDELSVKKILVARPNIPNLNAIKESIAPSSTYFYPSLVRTFKNFEILLSAFEILQRKGLLGPKLILTISKDDGSYASRLCEKYKHLKNVSFIGKLSRDEVNSLYKSGCNLIFPSKLETWGLPLTEAKSYNLNILASDLPYAKETIGNYNKVIYFDPDDASSLANILQQVEQGEFIFQRVTYKDSTKHEHVSGWGELLSYIIYDN